MDSTKHKNISGNLEVWTVDGAVKMRVNFGMSARVVTLEPGEAIDLSDWILYTYLEVERPEIVVPEKTDDMPF